MRTATDFKMDLHDIEAVAKFLIDFPDKFTYTEVETFVRHAKRGIDHLAGRINGPRN